MSAAATAAGSVEGLSIYSCPLNAMMTVTAVRLDSRHVFRLQELGLSAGCRIRVIQRSAFGGRVVAVGRERLALDARTASRIDVALSERVCAARVDSSKDFPAGLPFQGGAR